MSGWGLGWFGGATAAPKKKDAPKSAILKLRGTLDMLMKRETHLQNQMDEQDAIARKSISTNKAAAKVALRRKKGYEHSLEQTTAQMATIEKEIMVIETANINKETFDAMTQAGGAIKNIHKDLNLDKVDQVMEDLREQHAIGDEIATALTQGGVHNQMDEEELDEELEALEQEALDDKMLRTGTLPVADKVQRLPTPAGGELKGKAEVEEEDVEEELRKMQAEMTM